MGAGRQSLGANPGGLGAQIGGDFLLTQGQILTIAVGGQGESTRTTAGGGGGTFVVGPGNVPFVIAGGGGGGNRFFWLVALVSPLLREERP